MQFLVSHFPILTQVVAMKTLTAKNAKVLLWAFLETSIEAVTSSLFPNEEAPHPVLRKSL